MICSLEFAAKLNTRQENDEEQDCQMACCVSEEVVEVEQSSL